MTIKHSKYKNTGMLFELLIRQVASDILAGQKNSKALVIIEQFFSKKCELGKELILYRSAFGKKTLTETKALDFVTILIEQRKKLNNKKLKEEKYNLVKTIKEHYALEKFLSVRIPSYRIFASIYKNFECAAQGYTFENVQELSQAKYTLVEHLCGDITNSKQLVESEIMQTLKQQDDDLRHLTVRLMFEKFNTKYESFNSKQKILLREILHSNMEKNELATFARKEASDLSQSIISKVGNLNNDVQQIKLKEVVRQLNNIQEVSVVERNHLTALMIGYELEHQLTKFQSNNE